MSGAALVGVRAFVRRNLVSVTFPVLCFGSIAADYSHTKAWKASKKAAADKAALSG